MGAPLYFQNIKIQLRDLGITITIFYLTKTAAYSPAPLTLPSLSCVHIITVSLSHLEVC